MRRRNERFASHQIKAKKNVFSFKSIGLKKIYNIIFIIHIKNGL